ncbi:MAG: RDD family protein [Cyanobacteria bacterium]|nr:RDD family protein [Cyanobacteriota bacterium]
MYTSNTNHTLSIPAGFWLRAVAFLIDAITAFIVYLFVCFSTGALGATLFGQEAVVSSAQNIAFALQFIVPWLYFAIMESSEMQATLGKRALGLKVTDINGNRLSFARATGRHFGKVLSALMLGIGFLMIAFTPRRQGLHDVIADTSVVKLVEVPVARTWSQPTSTEFPTHSFFN